MRLSMIGEVRELLLRVDVTKVDGSGDVPTALVTEEDSAGTELLLLCATGPAVLE